MADRSPPPDRRFIREHPEPTRIFAAGNTPIERLDRSGESGCLDAGDIGKLLDRIGAEEVRVTVERGVVDGVPHWWLAVAIGIVRPIGNDAGRSTAD